jgi:hypothetical protein
VTASDAPCRRETSSVLKCLKVLVYGLDVAVQELALDVAVVAVLTGWSMSKDSPLAVRYLGHPVEWIRRKKKRRN